METSDNTVPMRLKAKLAEHHLLASDGSQTIYGKPVWRSIAPGHEPERLMDATRAQRDLVVFAHATPATGPNQCAAWVEHVFSHMNLGVIVGDAADLARRWCTLTDTRALNVGMIMATSAHPFGTDGRAWGHVGIYIGDRRVMDSVEGRVRTSPLDAWISVYGVMADVQWGWLGGIALNQLTKTL